MPAAVLWRPSLYRAWAYRSRFLSTRQIVRHHVTRCIMAKISYPTSRWDVAVTNRHCSRTALPLTRPETNLQRENVQFIEPNTWPPNNEDLNPADYAIWGAVQQTVYHHQSFSSVDEMKTATVKAWQKLPHGAVVHQQLSVNGDMSLFGVRSATGRWTYWTDVQLPCQMLIVWLFCCCGFVVIGHLLCCN